MEYQRIYTTQKRIMNTAILVDGAFYRKRAKQARREGIDFLLNPLGAPIKSDLFEHIDGLINWVPKKYK